MTDQTLHQHRDPAASAAASSAGGAWIPMPAAADLYGDIEADRPASLRRYLPGLLITALAMLSAGFLADRYGAPLALMGLLIGLALNFLSHEDRLHPGLNLTSGPLLRIGIILAGLRVTVWQIADLGFPALLSTILIVALTLVSGIVAARLLGFGRAYGTLAGGAVAICGASAALAIATVLGNREEDRARLALVLVGISMMSALAMSFYPLVASAAGLDDRQAGFFLGASIHDVAQALGAGYAYSDAAGQTATIVKLTRVALLAPTLLLISLLAARTRRPNLSSFPWFILGFFGMVLLNSASLIPAAADSALSMVSSILIASAVTAAGVRAPLSLLLREASKPLLVIAIASCVSAASALAMAIICI